jgi:HEAT repeat protein
LWTFDDVVGFIKHPDLPVRRWALERLTKRFPAQAGNAMVVMLDDADDYIARTASKFLSETGDGETYGPLLLERLRQSRGCRFGYITETLAHLDHRQALPLIMGRVERARRDGESIDSDEFRHIVKALGVFGGDKGQRTLWKIADSLPPDDRLWDSALIGSLLNTAQPKDVSRIVQLYRFWSACDQGYHCLGAFASAVGADRVAQEAGYAIQDGLDATLKRVEEWMGQGPVLSEECQKGLRRAFENGHRDTFGVLLHEARNIIAQRGDDVDGWLETWEAGERPVGYRLRTSLTMLILSTFATHPSVYLEQRVQESSLGVALLCQLSLDCNDQARLDASKDQVETLLNILIDDRDNLLPDIIERVIALGPEVVPRLIDRFDPEDPGWGPIRIAQALAALARRYPGSCDAAAPVLVEAIDDKQGDFLLEAVSEALESIGAPAVPSMIERMRDDDISRQIYLTYSLGQIPTESAAQAILGWIADGQSVEEMHITSLSDIGSPLAIEPLSDLWESGHALDTLLAEALLVLCELNGVQRPQLSEWRRVSEAEEARFSLNMAGLRTQVRLTGQAPSLVWDEPASAGRARRSRRRRKRQRG